VPLFTAAEQPLPSPSARQRPLGQQQQQQQQQAGLVASPPGRQTWLGR
jgi:hypothetical protein